MSVAVLHTVKLQNKNHREMVRRVCEERVAHVMMS